MASFNDNRRGEGPKRRPGDPRRRRQSVLAMELLENRRLLAATPSSSTWHPTDSNLLDAQNGPMANLGPDSIKVYSQFLTYVAAGAKGTFNPTTTAPIEFVGVDMGIDIRGTGSLTTYIKSLQSEGMVVTAFVASIDLVEGYVPPQDLPQIAENPLTVGGLPMYKPVSYQQGISPNQADVALNAVAAKTTYGLTGAGQKLGVLSTDDGSMDGGLAASVASGDLPPNVQTIADNSGTTDDEGRAMLEQIYDIDPQAALAFATGFTGEATFANNIQALFNAGATTIVDDIGYFDDPYYQTGIIGNSVNSVVAAGGTYLSSAGNADDSGYESSFRR